MKNQRLFRFAVSLSTSVALVSGGYSLSAKAQTTDPFLTQPMPVQAALSSNSSANPSAVQTQQSVSSPAARPANPNLSIRVAAPSTITIQPNTGIIVSFSAPVVIDADEVAYPMTLPLSQPIMDAQGNVIVPANSPVSVLIEPEEGSARVVAQSIVINGQVVPIQAASDLIPGRTVTHMHANDRAADEGATFSQMTANGFGFFSGGDRTAYNQGAMLGNFLGMAAGRQDDNSRIVQIPQGSVYVLALEEAVHISR